MASMEIIHLLTKENLTSWSANVTYPSGKPTGIIVVAIAGRYGSIGDTVITIGGVTATKFASENTGYDQIHLYARTNVAPGTYTINVGSSTHEKVSFVYCVTNCRGWATSNIIPHNEISGTNVHSPNLEVGQLWVEQGLSNAETYMTGGSSQSILVSYAVPDSPSRYRILYKLDPGIGTKSFSVTFPVRTDQSYLGVEYLPFGKIFEIPPIAIG